MLSAEKGDRGVVHFLGGDTMKKALLTLVATVVSLIAAANVAGACICIFYQPEID